MRNPFKAIRRRRRDREKIEAVERYCKRVLATPFPVGALPLKGASFNAWAARRDMAALILATLKD